MLDLNYFEKMAETAIFATEEKEIKTFAGNVSLEIRESLTHKKNFTDATLVASLEIRE